MKMRGAQLAVAALILCANACSDDTVAPQLTSHGEIQIRPAFTRMLDGDVRALNVVAFDDGNPVFVGPVRWTTLDSTIVSVDSVGAVRAVAPGWARVIATSVNGGQSDTAVIAVGLKFVDIAGGFEIACGLTANASAYCWSGEGPATVGALGTGAMPTSWTPSPVAGGHGFSAIAPGFGHTCALASSIAYCWGSTLNGAMGTTICAVRVPNGCHTPEKVQTTLTFNHIAVARGSTVGASCATGPGGLVCWGRGPLARPGSTCLTCTPQLISNALTGSVAVGSAHACALNVEGNALCWGDNRFGQLGATIPAASCTTSACTASKVPVPVASSERFTDLAASSNATCGLAGDGHVYCWGAYHRYASSLQSPPLEPGPQVVAVGTSLRFRSIASSAGTMCGVAIDSALYCWGDASWTGALGEPRMQIDKLVVQPTRVMPGETFIRAAPTAYATCGVTTRGEIVCLGEWGALGQGSDYLETAIPLPIAPPGNIPTYISGNGTF